MNWSLFCSHCEQRGLDASSLAEYGARREESWENAVALLLFELEDAEDYRALLESLPKSNVYLDGLECIPKLAGCGSLLGQQFHHLLFSDPHGQEDSARLGSLWNLIQAYFDDIIDEYTGLDEALVSVISESSIEKYLTSESVPESSPFIAPEGSHVLVRFVLSLCRRFFALLASLPGRRTRPALYAQLVEIILKAYRAQLESAPTTLGETIVPAHAGPLLAARSIEPMRAMIYSIKLTQEYCSREGLNDPLIFVIADFFRLVDDTTDLEDDLNCRYWNSALTDFVIESRIVDPNRPVSLELFELNGVREKAAHYAMKRLFKTYDALASQFESLSLDGKGVSEKFLQMAYYHAKGSMEYA